MKVKKKLTKRDKLEHAHTTIRTLASALSIFIVLWIIVESEKLLPSDYHYFSTHITNPITNLSQHAVETLSTTTEHIAKRAPDWTARTFEYNYK